MYDIMIQHLLGCAASSGRLEILKLLVEAGADVNGLIMVSIRVVFVAMWFNH
jgi:hypothetical protein